MFANLLLSGAVQGIAVALVASGFTLIYNATGVVNFAHGQFLAIGAYTGLSLHVRGGAPFWLTLLVVVAVGAALGLLIDRGVVGALRRASLLVQVAALLAVSQIAQAVLRLIYGARELQFPAYASRDPLLAGVAASTPLNLIIAGAAAAGIALLWAFLYLTPNGAAMRATAQNRVGASLVGINPRRVAIIAWTAGGALSALTGLLLAPNLLLTPHFGFTITLTAFAAVVLGGFGSVPGALVGGLLVGVSQSLVGGYLAAGYEPLVILVILVVVLALRPSGLLGVRGRLT